MGIQQKLDHRIWQSRIRSNASEHAGPSQWGKPTSIPSVNGQRKRVSGIDLTRTETNALPLEEEITDTSVPNIGPPPLWNPTERMFVTHLSVDIKAHGFDLGEGSEIYYSDRGRLTSIQLSKETSIFGNLYPENTILYFFRDGSVDWVSLSSPMSVNSKEKQIPWVPGYDHVSFYRNGNIKETLLSQSFTINDNLFAQGTTVHFSNHGELTWAQLTSMTSLKLSDVPLLVAENSCVEFHHGGSPRSVILAQPTMIQGHYFQVGVQLKFDLEGKLALAQMTNSRDLLHKKPSGKTRVLFQRDGKIREITSA